MAKKRNGVPKTLQYFVEKKPLQEHSFAVEGPIIRNGRFVHQERLSWDMSEWRPFYPKVFAWFIRKFMPSTTRFYVDTCFLSGPQFDDEVWDALLEKQIILTSGVWQELQDWLRRPDRNCYMRDAILANHPSIMVLDHDLNRLSYRSTVPQAFMYYEWLLGHRKRYAWFIRDDHKAKHGCMPSESEFQKIAQSVAGMPGYSLMKKAINRRGDFNLYNDEQLVVQAVFDGLINGTEPHILTRDLDVFDQFHRLLRLIDHQYLSMLFAEHYEKFPGGLRARPLPLMTPELRHYFIGNDNLLVEKPDDYLSMILPEEIISSPLYCILHAGHGQDMKYASLAYKAERDMERLLQIKATTGGLNTDRLSGKNCHVTGFPKGVDNPRRWVIISNDCREYEYYFMCSRLDYAHVLHYEMPFELMYYCHSHALTQ